MVVLLHRGDKQILSSSYQLRLIIDGVFSTAQFATESGELPRNIDCHRYRHKRLAHDALSRFGKQTQKCDREL